MSRRERLAWWVVCAVPKFLAKWLMFGKLGQRVRLPKSWTPFIFGRALGVDGAKCRIKPTDSVKLPIARAERPTAQIERIAG